MNEVQTRTVRSAREREFLPAALEIQETPPAPAGRAIAWLVMLFFAATVAWSWLGHTDIVAVAPGKIVPTGRSKVIQPLELGRVKAIHVEEGQTVRAGDLLVELDPTVMRADEASLEAERRSAVGDAARIDRLLAAVAKAEDTSVAGTPLAHPDPGAMLGIQGALLRSQLGEYRSRVRTVEAEIERSEAEHRAIQAEILKLERIVPLVTRRAEALRELKGRHLAPETEYLALEQERIERVQDLAALEQRLAETAAAIDEERARRSALTSEFQSSLLQRRAELEPRIAALEQELAKARSRTRLQKLRAPIDGVVQQLEVHTIGGVVTPAQPLMVIVPEDDRLEIEAWVRNRDVGFVHAGQEAEIKLDAFPFTRYGTIGGEVLHLSNDAIENEALGWAFAARIHMDADRINAGGRMVRLTPGMATTVEMKTGRRRLIEFFLSPLLRYRDESVRER